MQATVTQIAAADVKVGDRISSSSDGPFEKVQVLLPPRNGLGLLYSFHFGLGICKHFTVIQPVFRLTEQREKGDQEMAAVKMGPLTALAIRGARGEREKRERVQMKTWVSCTETDLDHGAL